MFHDGIFAKGILESRTRGTDMRMRSSDIPPAQKKAYILGQLDKLRAEIEATSEHEVVEGLLVSAVVINGMDARMLTADCGSAFDKMMMLQRLAQTVADTHKTTVDDLCAMMMPSENIAKA
jgi:hypothetical protein